MDLLNERRPDVAVLPRKALPISITSCEYDRTRPIADGWVKPALGSPVPQTYLRLATKTDSALFQPPLDVAAHYGYVVATTATDLMRSGA